jgi:hypothetical protein
MGKSKLLRAVGYWREELELLPHPRWFVRPRWRHTERPRIIAYLRSGHVYASYLGFSWCRFRCGIDDTEMGTSDLTDGQWFWPEGLAHYVACHGVRLPDEFVQTMAGNGWRVPEGSSVAGPDEGRHCDLSFWRSWSFGRGGCLWCWL